MKITTGLVLLTLQGVVCAATIDWPDFRGPWADGRASVPGDTNIIGLPWQWSETENVKWKTAIHDKGWSTPVILGGQVWMTTATADGHDFFAIGVDQATGKILCDKKIFHSDHPEPLGNDLNGYASPSPVIEAGRVYVHFGSYGTACLDTTTFAVLWQREDLPCRHYRGPGSSPILYRNLLILTMDGIDVQYLVALDKANGQTVWRTDRTTAFNDLGADGQPVSGGDLRKGFSTPFIIDVEGKTEMLSAGSKAFYSYDPVTGKELWKFRHDGFSPAARPLFDHGVIFVPTGNGKSEMLALKSDNHGDVTDSAAIWRISRASPRMPSPILDEGLLYMVTDNGVASCVEEATGKECWRERAGGGYAASILYADDHIYFFNQDGKALVVKASRQFEPVATNELSSGFMSSPAVSGKALFLRTKTDLYRIEGN